MIDHNIKKKILSWMSEQIQNECNTFDITSCINDIGLDPSKTDDIRVVKEVFEWHKQMIELILFEGIDTNT